MGLILNPPAEERLAADLIAAFAEIPAAIVTDELQGIHLIAIGCDDARACAEEVRGRGVSTRDPIEVQRDVPGPDGARTGRFVILRLEDGLVPECDFFLHSASDAGGVVAAGLSRPCQRRHGIGRDDDRERQPRRHRRPPRPYPRPSAGTGAEQSAFRARSRQDPRRRSRRGRRAPSRREAAIAPRRCRCDLRDCRSGRSTREIHGSRSGRA